MSIVCGKCGNYLSSGTVNSSLRCATCDMNGLRAAADEYRKRLKQERAENAGLRRQVERLVPFSQEAFILGYAWNSKGFTANDIDEAWQGHPHLLQQLDAILADEPGETE